MTNSNNEHLQRRQRAQDQQNRDRARRRRQSREELSPMDELHEIDACCRQHTDLMEDALHGRDEPAEAVDEPGRTPTLLPNLVSEPAVEGDDPMLDVAEPTGRNLDLDIGTTADLNLDLGGSL